MKTRQTTLHVVSCQVYGNMKRNQDSKADDIEALMHRFPHLRIAYIDNLSINRSGASVFYSVLVKSDEKVSIKEIYRVRLPGNPIIGERKPFLPEPCHDLHSRRVCSNNRYEPGRIL